MAVATAHRRFDDEGDDDCEETNDPERERRPGLAAAWHDRVLPRLKAATPSTGGRVARREREMRQISAFENERLGCARHEAAIPRSTPGR